MKAIFLLAAASLAFAADSATDILHRTAATYRQSGAAPMNVTVQLLQKGGERVSERAATRPAVFGEIDQHVKSASIAREERYMQDGKPVDIVIVRVSRDQWPEGTLPGAEFAMYRIDKQTSKVYKVITYAGDTTEIVFIGGAPSPAAIGADSEVSMVGKEAPDFTLVDSAGKSVHLRDLRGKVVVVDFWATWCGPCRQLMPHIEKMHENLASKGLVVLGLDVGEDSAKVAQFAKEFKYTFPLLLDAEPAVTSQYFVQAYPTTFVIDRSGHIAFRDLGSPNANELEAAVEKALSID